MYHFDYSRSNPRGDSISPGDLDLKEGHDPLEAQTLQLSAGSATRLKDTPHSCCSGQRNFQVHNENAQTVNEP